MGFTLGRGDWNCKSFLMSLCLEAQLLGALAKKINIGKPAT